MFVIGMKPALSYFKIVQVSVGNFLIIYFLNMLPLSSQSCLCKLWQNNVLLDLELQWLSQFLAFFLLKQSFFLLVSNTVSFYYYFFLLDVQYSFSFNSYTTELFHEWRCVCFSICMFVSFLVYKDLHANFFPSGHWRKKLKRIIFYIFTTLIFR